MTPWLEDGDVTVYAGDCIEVMRSLPSESVDAVICDPPYGLEFMGKEWDSFKPSNARIRTRVDGRTNGHEKSVVKTPEAYVAGVSFQAWCESWATEAYRVLKPGGHLAAFGGTRTAHRLASGIEDAGFEIRDTLAWLYGSGFPKSLDVSKAIDKAAGAEREVVGVTTHPDGKPRAVVERGTGVHEGGQRLNGVGLNVTAPATPGAATWQGWGTALKPAHEPITLARKPIRGTVAANVLAHGTGAINIDACRIEHQTVNGGNLAENPHLRDSIRAGRAEALTSYDLSGHDIKPHAAGRWPANVILDADAAAMLDEQTGECRSAGEYVKGARGVGPKIGAASIPIDGLTSSTYADNGGASRFFYTAKASGSERNDGLHDLPASTTWRTTNEGLGLKLAADGRSSTDEPTNRKPTRNVHPTVKPVDLMRWLIRLLAPPGALILDPFAGSGTTGVAARRESVRCILIEREAEYLPIIAGRLSQLSLLGEMPA